MKKSIQEISKIYTSDYFVSISVSSKNSKQDIFNAIDDKVYEPTNKLKFQGTFGVASEEKNNFEYLYLSNGKLLKKGDYKIVAVNEAVTAELKLVDGKFYYSSDKPVLIQLKKGKSKEYPAGYNIEIK